MIAVAGQMVLCLLVAAAIGVLVGWLLRHRSALPHEHRLADLDTELRIKGQALDTAIYELKVKTSALMALESRVASLESLDRTTQQELTSRQERIDGLQQELRQSQAKNLSSQSELQTGLERLADQETTLAAYANEVRQANAARTKAQQDVAVKDEDIRAKEQEILVLQQRLKEEESLVDHVTRLQTKLDELEPAQGRVHWLEVQLSEKEAAHRNVVTRLEQELAGRDRRLAEQADQTSERDARIAGLERRLADLHALQAEFAGQAKVLGDQEEEISRLRKRLGEVRAALRGRDDGGAVLARSHEPANQLSLQMPPAKTAAGARKDNLKKIQGISPAIERALNKMGTFTYVQIARWKPTDIARIVKKLDTVAGRIKPDAWIAGAKKQHREKYGEKL
jgi:predicted flap endonuclease-1-like 5' DNA nuclease